MPTLSHLEIKPKTSTELVTKYPSFHPLFPLMTDSPYLSMILLSQYEIIAYGYFHQFYISDSLRPVSSCI